MIMKRSVSLGLTVILVLALGCAAHSKSVSLAHKFKKGQVDKYRFSMDMKMHLPGLPIGPQSMTMKMSTVMKQKVLHVENDGSATLDVSISDFKISCPQIPDAQAPKMPATSMRMTLSKDGRLLAIEGMDTMMARSQIPGLDFSQLAGQMGCYSVFPEVPIEVGQSWRNTIPMPFDCGEMNVDSTLVAAALPVGNGVASKIRQTYDAYMDFGKIMQAVASSNQVPAEAARMAASMNGGMDMVGWTVLYFSPDRGKLLKANGSMQAVMNIDMPAEAVAQGAPSRLNMKMSMDLNMARI